MRVLEFTSINDLSSVFIKKMLSVFLVAVLLLSGFVPKNREFKNNFMSALNCAVNTVQTNFYDQYSNVVMSVINNILTNFNIAELAGTQVIKTETQKQESDKQFPANNTSSDSAVIVQSSANGQVQTLKANLGYLVYETTNKLYNLCESIKVIGNKETSTMGILFFILFSVLVVRIKDTIAVVLNNKIIVRKPTWLSV